MEKFEATNFVKKEHETPWDIINHDLYGDGRHNNYYVTASIVWGNVDELYGLCVKNDATIISATMNHKELSWSGWQHRPKWVEDVVAKENADNNVLVICDLEKADALQQEWICHLVKAADSDFIGFKHYNPPKGKVKICLLWRGEPIHDIYEPLARRVMFIKL